MKHLKRSDCRTQARKEINEHYCDGSAPETVEMQINQAWKRKEEEETARIKKEIDISWEEYNASSNESDDEDDSIAAEIATYFEATDDEDKEPETLYSKNKKRSIRRRATARAKKRLLIKAESAMKNIKKRGEEDSKNHDRHASEQFKSRVARCNALEKRAKRKRLQR